MSNKQDTDPPGERPKLRRIGTITQSGRWVPLNSPRYSPALQAFESPELEELMAERTQLLDQLHHVKDLSSRLIDKVEAQDQRIAALEAELKSKETLIHDLEAEAAQIIAHASDREDHVTSLKNQLAELSSSNDELAMQAAKREDRISQLESFLEMIANAERE